MDEDTAFALRDIVLQAFDELVRVTGINIERPRVIPALNVLRPKAEVVMTEFSKVQKDCYGLSDGSIIIDMKCERPLYEKNKFDLYYEAQMAAGNYFARQWLRNIDAIDFIRFRRGERFPFTILTAQQIAQEIRKERTAEECQNLNVHKEFIDKGCWHPRYPASRFVGGYATGLLDANNPKRADPKKARPSFRETLNDIDDMSDFEQLIYVPIMLGVYAALTRKADGFKALIETKPENLAMCLNYFYREVIEV
jgi:hypothetical protein